MDFIGVAEHELSNALGRIAGLDPYRYSALDLFRYAAPSELELSPDGPAYFSIDGGRTNLENFATSGDLGDWASGGSADANNAIVDEGVENPFSVTDITEMAALGFDSPALHDRTLNGAGGHKTFTFSPNPGHVVIDGLKVAGVAHDTLHLPSPDFTSLHGVLINATMSDAGVVIHFGNEQNDVTLAGVNKAELRAHPQDFRYGY